MKNPLYELYHSQEARTCTDSFGPIDIRKAIDEFDPWRPWMDAINQSLPTESELQVLMNSCIEEARNITGVSGIDYFIAPHLYEIDTRGIFNAISSRDNRQLPSHNLPMLQRDQLAAIGDVRYRDCLGCMKSFKNVSDAQWLCDSCQTEEDNRKHRNEVGDALNDANGVFK